MMSECRENHLYGLPFGQAQTMMCYQQPKNHSLQSPPPPPPFFQKYCQETSKGSQLGWGKLKMTEKSHPRKMERRQKAHLSFCRTVSLLTFFPVVSTFPHHTDLPWVSQDRQLREQYNPLATSLTEKSTSYQSWLSLHSFILNPNVILMPNFAFKILVIPTSM